MTAITLDTGSSGAGSFVITAPSTSSTNILTLPNSTGSLVSTGDVGVVTGAMLAPGAAGTGPLFQASKAADQSFSPGGGATLMSFDTVIYDTNTGYDDATYSFTPNIAGYYQIGIVSNVKSSFNTLSFKSMVYKNGSVFREGGTISVGSTGENADFSCVVYLDGASDYVQAYGQVVSGSSNALLQSESALFYGYLVRSA